MPTLFISRSLSPSRRVIKLRYRQFLSVDWESFYRERFRSFVKLIQFHDRLSTSYCGFSLEFFLPFGISLHSIISVDLVLVLFVESSGPVLVYKSGSGTRNFWKRKSVQLKKENPYVHLCTSTYVCMSMYVHLYYVFRG